MVGYRSNLKLKTFKMKKRKILRYMVLCKRFIQSVFKVKKNNALLDNEKLIMELLFKDIATKDSIILYNKVTEKFFKQLKNRENKAKSEIQVIAQFRDTFENVEILGVLKSEIEK